MKKQTCTAPNCGKPSVLGLLRGKGKCRYHWAEMNWGKEWADKCATAENSKGGTR